MKEFSIVLIKPNLVSNHQAINVICDLMAQLHTKGHFVIKNMKKMHMTSDFVKSFYFELQDKPFFKYIDKYMTSGDIIALQIEGDNVISVVRSILGATNPKEAAIGTLRQKYAVDIDANGTHGSDSFDNAKREYTLLFNTK